MTMPTRILIADDHKMVREGLRIFFAPSANFEIVGEASDGFEAVEQTVRLQPDVVLLDLAMPNMDGINAAIEIKKKCLNTNILIITSSYDESKVIESIKAGAKGYLLKDSSPKEIENAILKVHAGETAFPSSITSIMLKELTRPINASPKHSTLTRRENEILKLVATGLTNEEISDQLFLSVWTVRSHIKSIMEKLGFDNRSQVTLYALREGLVTLN